MKRILFILLPLLPVGVVYADWRFNPYTQRQDYYESTTDLYIATATLTNALNSEILRATIRENAIAVSTGVITTELTSEISRATAREDAIAVSTGVIDANKVNKSGDTMTGSLLVQSDITANAYYGDGSHLTGVRDNLGNHIATMTISAPYGISATTINTTQAIITSSDVVANAYYGDGSHLTGVSASGGMTNPMTSEGDLIIGGVDGEPTRLGQDNFITAQSGDLYDQKQILTLGRHGLKWLRMADYRAALIYGRNGTIDIAEATDDFTIPAIEEGGNNRIVFKNIFQITGQNLAGKQRGCILTSRPIGYGDFPQPYTIELGDDGQVLTSDKNNADNVTGIAWKDLPTTTLGDNLGNHIATTTISAPYGISATTITANEFTVDNANINGSVYYNDLEVDYKILVASATVSGVSEYTFSGLEPNQCYTLSINISSVTTFSDPTAMAVQFNSDPDTARYQFSKTSQCADANIYPEKATTTGYIGLSSRGGFGNSWSSIFTFHTSEYDPTRVYGYFHSEHDNGINAVVCRDVGAGRYLGVSALSSIRFFSQEGMNKQFKGTLRLYKTKSGACID